jgi:YVTN family beta-propeller protein
MHLMRHLLALALALAIGMADGLADAADPLRLARTIPLGNVAGRIDHMAADPDGQQLFVAALGNNTVEVVDLKAGKVLKSISGFHEPQGVAFVKDKELIAVASGEDGKCRLIHAKSLNEIKTYQLGVDADNVRYAAMEKRLYIGFGNGAMGVIDMEAGKRLADIKLAAHPESFQLETNGPRIFVNLPSAHQISVLDRKRGEVVANWPVEMAQANFPMALDETGHRAFIGCRSPAKVLVYDTESGKSVAEFSTVGDTDDLFYDQPARRLYVCGGEGFIAVHQKREQDHFAELARIPTAAGARTALFVPSMDRLFVAVPRRGSQAAELRVYEVAN